MRYFIKIAKARWMKGTVQQVMDRASKIHAHDTIAAKDLEKKVKLLSGSRVDRLQKDFTLRQKALGRFVNKNSERPTVTETYKSINPYTKETASISTHKNEAILKAYDAHVKENKSFSVGASYLNERAMKEVLNKHFLKPKTPPRFKENETSMYNRLMHKTTGKALYDRSPYIGATIKPSAENAVNIKNKFLSDPDTYKQPMQHAISLTKSLRRGDLHKFDAKEIESILKNKGLRTGLLKPKDVEAIRKKDTATWNDFDAMTFGNNKYKKLRDQAAKENVSNLDTPKQPRLSHTEQDNIRSLDRNPAQSHALLKVDNRMSTKEWGEDKTLNIAGYLKGHNGVIGGQITSEGKDILKTLHTLPKATGTGGAPSKASYAVIDEALTQGLPLSDVRNIPRDEIKSRLEALKNAGSEKKFMDNWSPYKSQMKDESTWLSPNLKEYKGLDLVRQGGSKCWGDVCISAPGQGYVTNALKGDKRIFGYFPGGNEEAAGRSLLTIKSPGYKSKVEAAPISTGINPFDPKGLAETSVPKTNTEVIQRLSEAKHARNALIEDKNIQKGIIEELKGQGISVADDFWK